MATTKLFIKKLAPPVSLLLPCNVDELLDIIAKYTEIGDTTSAAGFINTASSKEPPEDTSVLWNALDALGFPLGQFKFNDGRWLSTTFTEGVTILPYVGPAIIAHPHWRICDPNVIGQPVVNGITIPDMKDRMMVMASPGAKYNIGDIGGEDLRKILTVHLEPHDHGVGNYTIAVEEVDDHTHLVGDWKTGEADEGEGGTANPIVNQTRQSEPAGKHKHNATLNGRSEKQGSAEDFDVRSLFYAVGFAIYVGVGDDTTC